MKEVFFTNGDVRLFGLIAGSGTPVIMLHGITANAYIWEPILESLSKEFTSVAIDQRGHGRSDAPIGDVYGPEHYAQDVIALIEELDQGPAIVLGHSLGCRNAMHAAVMAPELIHSVVAVEFTPFIEREVLDALEKRVNAGARTFSTYEDVEVYLRGRYPLLTSDAIRRRAQYGYSLEADGYHPLADKEAMAKTAEGLKLPLQGVFEAVRVPSYLVRGAQSTLVSPAAFERTCQLRPEWPSATIDGTDHYIPEERTEELESFVRQMAHTSPHGEVK